MYCVTHDWVNFQNTLSLKLVETNLSFTTDIQQRILLHCKRKYILIQCIITFTEPSPALYYSYTL